MEEKNKDDLYRGNEPHYAFSSADYMPEECHQEESMDLQRNDTTSSIREDLTVGIEPSPHNEEEQAAEETIAPIQATGQRRASHPQTSYKKTDTSSPSNGNKTPKASVRGQLFQILSGAFLSQYPWAITIFCVVALWSTLGIWQSYKTNNLISRIDHLETQLETTYRKQQQLSSKLHSAIRPDEVELRLQTIGSTLAPSNESSFLLYVVEPEGLYEEDNN